jgi:hypothetical protein
MQPFTAPSFAFALEDTLGPDSVSKAVPIALLPREYVPVAATAQLVVSPFELPLGSAKIVVAPESVAEVTPPVPSKTRVPTKVAGEIMFAPSPCINETAYVPDRLAFE